ncbi:hypothetical protein D3C72_2194680 [compost metagenome]
MAVDCQQAGAGFGEIHLTMDLQLAARGRLSGAVARRAAMVQGQFSVAVDGQFGVDEDAVVGIQRELVFRVGDVGIDMDIALVGSACAAIA